MAVSIKSRKNGVGSDELSNVTWFRYIVTLAKRIDALNGMLLKGKCPLCEGGGHGGENHHEQ